MPGTHQHVTHRAELDEFAEAQHRDPVGDLADHAEIVGDEQHGHAALALNVLDQFQDLRLGGHVERGGGLVGDQQHGFEHQRHGDHDALALAARKLVRIGGIDAFRIRDADATQHGKRLFPPRRRAERSVRRQHFVDLIPAGHHRIEGGHRLLEDHRHARGTEIPQPRLAREQDLLALEPHGADGSQRPRQQAHHGLRRHRFSGARLADQAHDLAPVHGEAYIAYRMRALPARRQSNGEMRDLERGRHGQIDFAMRGSSASRRPSPSMFTASTVTATNTPGNRMVCG